MDEKIKALVIGVGGNVSIAIVKALRDSGITIHIFGACVQRYAAGFALCDESLICPDASHENFLPWLNKAIKKYNINLVLSGVEEVNYVLATVGTVTDECQILVPEKNNIDIFSDKLKTVNWLASNNINHPKTLDLGEGYSFSEVKSTLSTPFIVKPKIGKGSADILIIENERHYLTIEDLKFYIAQELIGDENTEYTCGVYKSKFGYTEILVMRRLLRNGSTVMAEVVENKEIVDYCTKIADACTTTSPFNIQLRLCSKTEKPFCFEVNMRLSGTTSIRHGFGFKDCQVWVKESVQNKNYRSDFNVKPAVAMRYESEVFLDKATVYSLNLIKPISMLHD